MANDGKNPVERFLVEIGLDPQPLVQGIQTQIDKSRQALIKGFSSIDKEVNKLIKKTNEQAFSAANSISTAQAKAVLSSLRAEREAILVIQDRAKANLSAAATEVERNKAIVELLAVNEQLAETDLNIAKQAEAIAKLQLQAARAFELRAEKEAQAQKDGEYAAETAIAAAKATELRAAAQLKLAAAMRTVAEAERDAKNATLAKSLDSTRSDKSAGLTSGDDKTQLMQAARSKYLQTIQLEARAQREATLAVKDRIKEELALLNTQRQLTVEELKNATSVQARTAANEKLFQIDSQINAVEKQLIVTNIQLAQSNLKIANAAVEGAEAEVKGAKAALDAAKKAEAANKSNLALRVEAAKAAERQAQAELKLAQALRTQGQAQADLRAAQRATPKTQAPSGPNQTGLMDSAKAMFDKLNDSTGGLIGQFGKLGAAIGIIDNLVDGLKELINQITLAAKATIAFERSEYLLETAIRASQRTMGDQIGTIAEWKAEIQRLQAIYKTFSTQDLNLAVKNILDTTRAFKLTKEQTLDLVDAAIILANRSGESLEEVGRNISGFLVGEYGTALQKYGIDSSEALVQQRAIALGYKDVEGAGGQMAKVQGAINILLERTAPLAEDSAKSINEYAGRLQAAAAKSEEAYAKLGRPFAGILVSIEEVKAGFVKFVADFVTNIAIVIANVFAFASAWYEAEKAFRKNPFSDVMGVFNTELERSKQSWLEYFGQTRDGLGDTKQSIFEVKDAVEELDLSKIAKDLAKDFADAKDDLKEGVLELVEETIQASEEITEETKKRVEEATRDYNKTLQNIDKENQRDRLKAWDDYLDSLEDLQQDFVEGSIDAWEDYQNRLAEVDANGLEKRQELWRAYQDNISEIDEKAVQQRIDAWDDYQDKLEDIDTKGAQRREDLQINYNRKLSDLQREKQIDDQREEEDHQKRLRDIRNKYNIDIDEAVQKRDARAILNLMRRRNEELRAENESYEKSKKRRQEDYEEKQRQAKLQYDRELEDLEREEARQREAAKKSYDEKLKDIAIAQEKERAEALKNYQQELADLEREEAKQRAAALKSYQDKLKDLQETLAKRRAEELKNYQERLADLDQALRDKRQKALEAYRQELVDISQSAAEQRQELMKSYQERQRDLETAYAKRLTTIAEKLAEEEKITLESATRILEILTTYYGAGGYLDTLVQDFVKRYQTNLEIELTVKGGGKTQSTKSDSNTRNEERATNRAQGGIDLITSPRLFQIGERGQELMITAPVSNSSSISNASSGGGASNLNVNLQLDVTGRTDLFSIDFEDRVAEVLTDAILEARGMKR